MCRFALYRGGPVPISSLVTKPSNSIINQSFHSQERKEPLNGDGFGLAWYAEGHPHPGSFREVTPAWNSINLAQLARVTTSPCVLAHVRAATPGLAVHQLNCHPFTWKQFSFMHNGALGGFKSIRRRLLASLDDEAFNMIKGTTDSEHLFALFAQTYSRIERDDSNELGRIKDALLAAISTAEGLRMEAGIEEESALNLAVSDGRRAVVSRYVSEPGEDGPSLYCHVGRSYVCTEGECHMVAPDEDPPSAVIVASEPLSKDPGWDPVPPNHVVCIDEDFKCTMEPMDALR
mgnify:CR=1 FL=1